MGYLALLDLRTYKNNYVWTSISFLKMMDNIPLLQKFFGGKDINPYLRIEKTI
jgi:hypothetical protein